MDERITLLMGAGATEPCTGINTESLTKKVCEKEQEYWNTVECCIRQYPLIKQVYEDLKCYYKKNEYVSFEDIFHSLEMIESYISAKNEKTVKEFKSVFPMFTELIESYNLDLNIIFEAKNDLIKIVMEELAAHENDWTKKDNIWFKEFFEELGNSNGLDIFSLNYDTWLEQIFDNQYTDGYVPMDDKYSRFQAKKLFCSDKRHSINRVHGQICFTSYRPERRNKFVWENNCSFLKAKEYRITERTYPSYSGIKGKTQTGEQIDIFPIITGLRKTDKITNQPFDSYYHHLYESIMNNEYLLIIGYGFGDLYINSLLKQFTEFHGENGRAVVITFKEKREWSPCIYDNNEISVEEKQFYYHLFREEDLSYRMLGIKRPDVICSDNANKRIYTIGFEETVKKYKNDLFALFKNQ